MTDLVVLGLFGSLAVAGWRTGLVRRLVGLGILAASFVLAAYLRGPVGAFVSAMVPVLPGAYAGMIGYSVAFGALTVGLNLVAGVLVSRVAVRGMSRATDQALGAALGLAEAALITSALIVILHTYSDEVALLARVAGFGLLHDIANGLDASLVGRFLEGTTVPVVLAVLGPLLPGDITSLVPTTIPGLPGSPR